MPDANKNLRIRTEVGKDKYVTVKLDRDYDILEIMSVRVDQRMAYRMHTSDYGVLIGRAVANRGFGVPNAKISVFIPRSNDQADRAVDDVLYPYNSIYDKDRKGIRYNLFPNTKADKCHTVIGTFPSKSYTLDNGSVLEVFEKYYRFSTRTNGSGDYMIFGIPVGNYTVHMDIDLSDVGILSQKPRDMVYKGYNITQFENPNKFKGGKDLSSLTQVVSQDMNVDVLPFWGEEGDDMVGITRCDINVNYTFESTCVFMGSVVSDSASNAISKRCVPTKNMGAMDELVSGSGTIEMIRKKPDGSVEEFQVMGTQLINGDGVWCYQIPMNLDYMMTDEYGNMVPTDNPEKGIATRTKVRFRISMQDFQSDSVNMFRCKMLVPNNPQEKDGKVDIDYDFGTNTDEDSYRDLFWNGVYTVKSYIPRIQKGTRWRSEKFTGIKRCNYNDGKNPIPYNNIRIRIPFMYTIVCALIKVVIWFMGVYNRLIQIFFMRRKKRTCLYISGDLCPDIEDSGLPWYFAPRCVCDNHGNIKDKDWAESQVDNTKADIIANETGASSANGDTDENGDEDRTESGGITDKSSIDYRNRDSIGSIDEKGNVTDEKFVLSSNTNHFIQCIEMNLAQEYKVIQFDFYNDWINGMLYIPRWQRIVKRKNFLTFGKKKPVMKIKACDESSRKPRNFVQQCSLPYSIDTNQILLLSGGCDEKHTDKMRCHKGKAIDNTLVFGKNGGIVKTVETMKKQHVYYFKPCEYTHTEQIGHRNVHVPEDMRKINLFATDIVMLGTLNDCNRWGVSSNLKELRGTTYQMPSNNVFVDSEADGQDMNGNSDKASDYYPKGSKVRINSSGLNLLDSDGDSRSEMSGIDWGSYGPYQSDMLSPADYDDAVRHMLYRPGGHFLGLSCTDSETSVVSCINLKRICEHGVWMSQRKEIDYPYGIDEEGRVKYRTYSLNPTGLISKDEISDTDFRKAFATINSNGLRTVKDPETGLPTYDMKYLSPSNFGGELKGNLPEGEYNSAGLSRNGWKGVSRNQEEIDSTEKRRTLEEYDRDYMAFRMGIPLNASIDSKKKKFLKSETYMVYSRYRMPVYENSFYFYFGIKDGATAIDEFKRQYYAVCEEDTGLVAVNEGIVINSFNVGENEDGISVVFDFNGTEDTVFPITVRCISEDGRLVNPVTGEFTTHMVLPGGAIESQNSGTGNIIGGGDAIKPDVPVVPFPDASITAESGFMSYVFRIKDKSMGYTMKFSSENGASEERDIRVKPETARVNAYEEEFTCSLEGMSGRQVMDMDHRKTGGYIIISENEVLYRDETLKAFVRENGVWRPSDDVIIQILENTYDKNVKGESASDRRLPVATYRYDTKPLDEDANGNVKIPVFRGDTDYRILITIKGHGDGRTKGPMLAGTVHVSAPV